VWRDERNNRRRRGKRQGYRGQIRGRGRGDSPLGGGETIDDVLFFSEAD